MSGLAAIRTTTGLRFREARRPVVLNARMRTERGWCDIVIRNLSSGGFMAQCNSPPKRGHYIEVWRGETCIVGYVVWSSGGRFGARSQARIDIPALMANRLPGPRSGERRKSARKPAAAPSGPRELAERSRQLGRAMEFAVLGTIVAAAAFLLAGIVGNVLGNPFAAIEATLAHSATGCAAPERRGDRAVDCLDRQP